jgi:LuxR family maltose regulon positive regulatory protein
MFQAARGAALPTAMGVPVAPAAQRWAAQARVNRETAVSDSISTQLIKTKITIPPLRPQMVVRKRLLGLLDDAANRPLTLISAPAGSGKTSLITSWLHDSREKSRVAWLSLDHDERDPAQFLSYIIVALQSIESTAGHAPVSLLGGGGMLGPKALTALLLNAMTETQHRTVLVLDDYHRVSTPDIDSSLAFLVERLPDKLRLIIATREEPNLPLAHWRSLERVAEIGMRDLRFTHEEATAFLKETMGLDIDASSARTLETRTDGWIAGLQLAALSLQLQGRDEPESAATAVVGSFSGRHRFVVDYLAAEVMRRQSEDTRAFLRQTAILDRLCAPLCDTLTGRTDSDAVLRQLERGNMFLMPLDEERQWYRYHELFADFLRATLRVEEVQAFHRKASAWFDARGLGEEAIRHAFAAKDVEGSIRLIRAHVENILAKGGMPTLLAWLKELPEDALRSYGDLAGYKALLLHLRGESAQAQAYSAVAIASGQHESSPAQSGTLLTFRAYLALNWFDPKESLPLARQALSYFGDRASFFETFALCLLGQAQGLTNDRTTAVETFRRSVAHGRQLENHLITLDALGHLATTLIAKGQLREAMLLCRAAVERHIDTDGTPLAITGLVHVPLGILHYETDELESARRFLTTGIDLCEQLGMSYFWVVGKCALAKLQHVSGQWDAAWTTLAAARELADRSESPRRRRLVTAATAELQLRAGNIDAAARTLEGTLKLPGPPLEHEMLMRARLLLAQHEPSMAWKLIQNLEQAATNEECEGSLIAINVLQALCKRALGQHSGAQERLANAVSLAATAGYRRVFLDEGETLAAMLEDVRHAAPDFVSQLLERLPRDQETALLALPEPLSKSEREILRLLNNGATNQEIADKLGTTVGTTKWHLNQIFGKLQVRNRTGAVARARQLKLL